MTSVYFLLSPLSYNLCVNLFLIAYTTMQRKDVPSHGNPRTCTIFIRAWVLNLGSLDFSRNKNNQCSSGAYVITCIYRGTRVKINTRKMLHGMRRLWADLFYVRGHQLRTQRPPIEPMADDAITILANCSSFGGTVPLFEAKKRMILSCVPVFAAIFV